MNYTCPLGRGAGSWPEQTDPPNLSLQLCWSGMVSGSPETPTGGPPGASTSFGSMETHRVLFSFSTDGDTRFDGRDGLAKVISSVRADWADTPGIFPLRAGNVEADNDSFNNIIVNTCSQPGNVLTLCAWSNLIYTTTLWGVINVIPTL